MKLFDKFFRIVKKFFYFQFNLYNDCITKINGAILMKQNNFNINNTFNTC